MLFLIKAKAAQSNVERYERELDRIELREIGREIKRASFQGYTYLRWKGEIRHNNLRKLEKCGYVIDRCHNLLYTIMW